MDEGIVKGVIEALLFISDSPLSIERMQGAFDAIESPYLLQCLDSLKKEYDESGRGLKIVEVAGGYQFVSAPQYLQFLKKFYRQKNTDRLRPAALETLAIIAYKQPLTRIDIEKIRGVNVDGVIKSLMDKGIIRVAGRKKHTPGRPFLYGTTRVFLERFGLNSLADLPEMEEFKAGAAALVDQEENIEEEKDAVVENAAQADKQAG
ncbi:MAG: SMC-Scp complex subunit ScpB [Candidatus Omnitrophica bacterium]|nr:SMC-Scp complex subunit ScpB [Candidatus Omnitrophota bacterium]